MMNEEICFDVSSVEATAVGVGGGMVIVARNESKSKLISLSLFRLLDKTVSGKETNWCHQNLKSFSADISKVRKLKLVPCTSGAHQGG